jgi:hypothetical protein
LQVERIFRQSAEFASEHDTWKLNVAHTFFMQEAKYREAIRFVAGHGDRAALSIQRFMCGRGDCLFLWVWCAVDDEDQGEGR